MKKSMPEFISVLAENDFENLVEIVAYKYRKFVKLYKVIRQYSDYITTLKYKKTKSDILKITMTITKKKIETVLEELHQEINDDESILIWNEGKIIHIEITMDESEKP